MLDFVRKKQKSILIKVAFAIIILSFIIGYAMLTSPGGGGDSPTSAAATVNDTEIGFSDYQTVYSNLYNLYQNIYREQFTPAMEKQLRLRQQALDALIEQALLLQEADRLGIRVTRQELVDSISRIPNFQENGTFSKDLYLQVLALQRISPEEFETQQKRQLLVEKVREALQKEIDVTDQDIEQEFRDRNEKINLAFARLEPGSFTERVRIEEKELENFFEERREEFRTPEKVSLRYIVFDPQSYRDAVTFDEGELERFYRRHLDRFETAQGDIKPLSEAMEEVKKGLREEKARQLAFEKAMDAYNMNRKGGSLEAAARANELPISETDFFGRQEAVNGFGQSPEITAAAFALQEGALGRPVKFPGGVVLFSLKDRQESRLPELSEVRPEVERVFRKEKARDLARQTAEKILASVREGQSLEKAARAQGAKTEETGFFTRAYGAFVPRLGTVEDLSKEAFLLKKQGTPAPEVFEIDGKFVVASLKEREEADLDKLDPAQREEIRETVKARKQDEIVKNRLQELREKSEIAIAPTLQAALEQE